MEIYKDVIHGTIILPPYVSVIIKHDLFQRLKSIRQLGFLKLQDNLNDHEIEHNRFKHSIGTYYLAAKFLNIIEKNTNDLKISKIYRQCVELAALLHDVGHGPFSHTWEFVDKNYNHELISKKVIDIIFSDINCEELCELKKDNNYGIELIKALITGKRNDFKLFLPTQYNFIFEIVSNKLTQIDVDKWDYLKRDHYYVSKYCSVDMDFEEFFYKARASTNGSHIEYNSSDMLKIFKLFRTRWLFYVNCYYLPSSIILNEIFCQIIKTTTFYAEYEKFMLYQNNCNEGALDEHFFKKFIDPVIYINCMENDLSLFLNNSIKFIQISPKEMAKEMKLIFNNYTGIISLTLPSVQQYFPKENLHLYSNENFSTNINDDTHTIRQHIQFICHHNDSSIRYVSSSTILHNASAIDNKAV